MTPTSILDVLGRGGVLGLLSLLIAGQVAAILLALKTTRDSKNEVIAVYREGNERMAQVAVLVDRLTRFQAVLEQLGAADAKRAARQRASLEKTVIMDAPALAKEPKP